MQSWLQTSQPAGISELLHLKLHPSNRLSFIQTVLLNHYGWMTTIDNEMCSLHKLWSNDKPASRDFQTFTVKTASVKSVVTYSNCFAKPLWMTTDNEMCSLHKLWSNQKPASRVFQNFSVKTASVKSVMIWMDMDETTDNEMFSLILIK